MSKFVVADSRTAIGLATNLPNSGDNDLYQIQNNLTYLRGRHLLKAGLDVRYNYVKSSSFSMIRGLLRYDTLQNFVLDRRRDRDHQQAAAGRGGDQLQPLVGPVLLRAGRVEAPPDADVEPRPALRAARQQHVKPDRAEQARARRQRQ